MDLLVSRSDYSLRMYQSVRTFHGATTTRALVIADTHYVAYREAGGRGDGESRVLPPGLLFVMDGQVITLFDLLCRTLQHAGFASRSLNLLALGPRDTLLDARAVVLGTETIRWGSKPVVARKLQVVADSQITLTLWVGSEGQLLRLIEPKGGLRAEREPPRSSGGRRLRSPRHPGQAAERADRAARRASRGRCSHDAPGVRPPSPGVAACSRLGGLACYRPQPKRVALERRCPPWKPLAARPGDDGAGPDAGGLE